MRVAYQELEKQFRRVLLKNGFPAEKAELCARIFAENSRDGVYSHGVNRFPVFVQMVQEGWVLPSAEPEKVSAMGVLEQWDGHLAPGMYTATLAMQRAIDLAKANGIGAVAVKHSNHWMRGGTYGWQAAEAGCIGICMTNTIANMPPWGGTEPTLGNNPVVIAVPRAGGHVVLDMAMTQYSFGKLQEYSLQEEQLPYSGGFNNSGELSQDPDEIRASGRALPIGLWKGAGLSLVIDLLVASLSGGRTVAQISVAAQEAGVSQFFLCIKADQMNPEISNRVIAFAKSSALAEEGKDIRYPGERTLATRHRNEQEGVPVNEEIWQQLTNM
ncbi:3-dehydro-L-gulonate 2-dehydrogenase [Rufibacter quisquiliarum]|uniref:3-dehydro-L-gulonate 2-dehydrogenase n=1 Tax=Rufibacter quisquiliarum TaxID=1549639 RepID=A0A839GHY3_9BACT|nr:3-dehydro-L-gulonate 2-dehydrogenase [Rufibacter quisquiliarum]MBA9077273.1 3-dehydro-L-gulonate 2-dehydrogenase [Rufibacter quisquiliarum]